MRARDGEIATSGLYCVICNFCVGNEVVCSCYQYQMAGSPRPLDKTDWYIYIKEMECDPKNQVKQCSHINVTIYLFQLAACSLLHNYGTCYIDYFLNKSLNITMYVSYCERPYCTYRTVSYRTVRTVL